MFQVYNKNDLLISMSILFKIYFHYRELVP